MSLTRIFSLFFIGLLAGPLMAQTVGTEAIELSVDSIERTVVMAQERTRSLSSDVLRRKIERITTARHKERPMIAVVLAGGGAKGVAHVPALKAIEDAGIPIDLVVGTSIGSIVGGLYCTGYSPDTMRTIIRQTDWMKLIMDNPDYQIKKTLSGKKDDESYVLRYLIDFSRAFSSTGRGGILSGNNVMRFFRDLTRSLPDTLDFSDMPVPFACVGTEAITGLKKVFTQGNLPTCMRASMAIPTAFTPVTIDSVVYVDGGVVDNFPVDVARAMGADVIIGVDLRVKQTNEQLTNSAIDMLLNCVDFYSRAQYVRNIDDADIYIPIDVTGYSAASFGATALDTLLHRGDHYVGLMRPALDSLSRALALAEPPHYVRLGEYSFPNAADHVTSWNMDESSESLSRANHGSLNSTFNFGFRFDNKEFASVKARFNLVLSQRKASLLVLEGRLGDRFDLKTDLSIKSWGTQRAGISYTLKHHDLDYLYGTHKAVTCDMRLNQFDLHFTQEWRSVLYTFGLRYDMFTYHDVLASAALISYLPKDSFRERHFSYFITGEINSLNKQYFPTSGQQWVVSADFISDNMATYKHRAMLPIVLFRWNAALSFTDRFAIRPHLYVRAIFKEESADKPYSLINLAGGFMTGKDFAQQFIMAGLFDTEVIEEDGLGIAGLTLQQRLFKNHYIQVKGDVLSHTNNIKYAFNKESLNWGVEASYNIKTPIGPLTAKIFWNDLSEKFKFFLNAGYYF